MLVGGALNALDYFFVTGNLGAPENLYGLITGVMGLGLIVGAILAGAFAQRIGLTRTIWISLLALAIAVIAYARMTDFWVAAALMAGVGVFQAALNVAVGPLLLQSAPRELIGRVSSILNPIITVATLAGAALAGYLDSTLLSGFSTTLLGVHFGPVDTILTSAGVIALAGALFAVVGLAGAHPSPHQQTTTATAEPSVTIALTPLVEEPVAD